MKIDGTTTTTLVGHKGGNETDYITYSDACGEVTCSEETTVQIQYTPGVGTSHTQDTDPTPRERELHGKIPTVFLASGVILSEIIAAELTMSGIWDLRLKDLVYPRENHGLI